MSTDPPPAAPRLAAGYRVVERLRQRPDATSYRAVRDEDGREVVLTVFHIGSYEDVARLQRLPPHPHLVQVLGSGCTDDGLPYLVLAYHPGGSYEERLGQLGPVSVDEAVQLCLAVGRALAAVHGAGLVHGDVTPGSILYGEDGPLLTDFHLAPAEQAGTVALELPTPPHAAPEVLLRRPADSRSDLYSLASTVWTLLAGHPPFAPPGPRRTDPFEHREQALRVPVPPIPRGDVPHWLQVALQRAMAKSPADRYPSVAALAAALRDQLNRHAPAAPVRPPPVGYRTVPAGEPPVRPDPAAPPVHGAAVPHPATPTVPVPTPPPAAAPTPELSPAAAPPEPPPAAAPTPEPPPAPEAPAPTPLSDLPLAPLPRPEPPPPTAPVPEPPPARVPEPPPAPGTVAPPGPGPPPAAPVRKPSPAPRPEPGPELPPGPGPGPPPASPPGPPPVPASSPPRSLAPPPLPPASFEPAPAAPLPPGPEPSEPEPPARRRISPALVGVLAFAITLGIVALAALATRPDPGPSGAPPDPATTQPATPPPATVSPPTGLELEDERVAVTLTWRDRSAGEASFTVIGGPVDADPSVFGSAPPGRTTLRIQGLNPQVEYCFRVLAVTTAFIDEGDEIPASDEICTERFPPTRST